MRYIYSFQKYMTRSLARITHSSYIGVSRSYIWYVNDMSRIQYIHEIGTYVCYIYIYIVPMSHPYKNDIYCNVYSIYIMFVGFLSESGEANFNHTGNTTVEKYFQP